MKQPFRYMRSEFTRSKYLYPLLICPNLAIQDVLDEFVYQDSFDYLSNIRLRDITYIATIAGVFTPRFYGMISHGSIYFHSVNENPYGEYMNNNALYDMEAEGFRFFQEPYRGGHVSKNLRASIVPVEAFISGGQLVQYEPVGYLPDSKQLYNIDRNVIWDNILPSPPSDEPSTPYYGEQFLTLENIFLGEIFIDAGILKPIFECMQEIRFNGPTLATFFKITTVLGSGYIHSIEIISRDRYYVINYKTDVDSEVTDKEQRLTAWQHIIKQKFKLFALNLTN